MKGRKRDGSTQIHPKRLMRPVIRAIPWRVMSNKLRVTLLPSTPLPLSTTKLRLSSWEAAARRPRHLPYPALLPRRPTRFRGSRRSRSLFLLSSRLLVPFALHER
ncbi:hypothetical protein PUN28_009257 [Cardiocondyla obscurior]|uniref:Uncharacterized protein n=1 Tax=Cardiocondyla obscurior TaxID=286306 RepID=A0AAW2FTH9_9HYME